MIKKISVKGFMEENCYFLVDDETNQGFIIDPGAEERKLVNLIDKNKWDIKKILLTHGHFDHIGAVSFLRDYCHAPVCAHKNLDYYLLNPDINLSKRFGLNIKLKADNYLSNNDIIMLNENKKISLRVIYTPGHTTDSCIFYSESLGVAFVGDTIFKNNIGSCQYPGGNESILIKSIFDKIFTLPGDTKLFPGHGEFTTVIAECK